MTEKKVKKNNWFKQFMIFLLVIVVAVSLGLIIFYFTQDGEKITKNQSKIQVNAKNAFTIDLVQSKYKSSTKIEAEYDKNALSIPDDGITSRVEGKNKITTYKFMANANDGSYVAGDYNIVFKTNAKDKASKELSVEVVIADGVNKAFFVGDAEQLKNIGSSELYASNKNYELTQDIDLKSLNEEGNRVSWTPLTNFSGTLNGNGKKISNLYIDAKDVDGSDLGLFAYLNPSAKVYNIAFEDAQIYSENEQVNAGIVAGQSSGTIERVSITSKDGTKVEVGKYNQVAATDVDQPTYALSSNVNVGAIVGVLKRAGSLAIIDRVAVPDAKVMVASSSAENSYVGGIAGLVQNGTIYNSYCRGIVDVKGSKVYAGGIAGKTETLASLIENNQAITTVKKANIINSYSKAQVLTNVSEKNTVGAVVAQNANLGLLSEVNKDTLVRTYVATYDSASDATKTAVAAACTDTDKFDYSISNKTALVTFQEKQGSEYVNKPLNVIYENRFVGVYYENANGLAWNPQVAANIATNVELAETIEEGAPTYKLITNKIASSANEYITYDYSKNTKTWDFSHVWKMDKNGNPTLTMEENTTVLDVYDPQSAFDGTINSVELLKGLNGQEGNFQLAGNDPDHPGFFVIKAEDEYEPIELKGKLYGNGLTVLVDYEDNKDFKGLFSKVYEGALVKDLTIKATVDTNATLGTDKGYGLVASENYGRIENVNVIETSITLKADKMTAKDANLGTYGLSAVAGYNKGTIQNVKTRNVRINLEKAFSGVSVGFIAGNSEAGSLNDVANYGACVISSTEKATISAGLIAGELSGEAQIVMAKACGEITLATDADANTKVAGIVAVTSSKNTVKNALVADGTVLKGNLVAGLVAYVNCSAENGDSIDAVEQSQVNENVVLEGRNVGGLIGTAEKGIIRDCATYATLKGIDSNSTISGFAYQVLGGTGENGDLDNCAQVLDSFASVTLDRTVAKKAYRETTSSVRKTSGGSDWIASIQDFWHRTTTTGDYVANPTKHKVAGYLDNCYFNLTKMEAGARQTPSADVANSEECGLNADDCKNKDNFSDEFKDTSIWFFDSEKMPVLVFTTSAEFAAAFPAFEEVTD